MIEYRFAKDEHRRDIIDFINYVFSQSSVPHDFKALLPKVYADGRGYADIHAVCLDDGYVRGVVAQLPQKFSFAGKELMTGYIGSVSTYKYTRGSGHMIKLMDMQAEKAEKDGIDIMLLGGQRQRYEYYGFSPCGTAYRYSIRPANIRHALKNVCADDIRFAPFEKCAECDIDKAFALYEKQPINSARTRGDFDIILRSWNCIPHVIYKKDAVVGYVVAGGKDSFSELVVSDYALVGCIVKAWFAALEITSLSIQVPDFDTGMNRVLAAFAESYSVSASIHAKIVNLKNVVDACLTLKNAVSPLPDGKTVYQMEGGKPVCAEIKNGEVSVYETDEKADISLDRLSMQQYLFSHNRFMAPEIEDKTGWLPLPLFLYSADHF